MATIKADRKPPDGWSFTVKEVSAGVYEVKATSADGLHMMRSVLGDYSPTLSKLIDEAWKLSQ
jgi:hypothetical protein